MRAVSGTAAASGRRSTRAAGTDPVRSAAARAPLRPQPRALVPHCVGLLGRWAQEHPQYAPEVQGPQRWGEHVVTAVRSTGGEAPGVAEGLLVHRVQDGLLQEGWGLPADPRSPS